MSAATVWPQPTRVKPGLQGRQEMGSCGSLLDISSQNEDSCDLVTAGHYVLSLATEQQIKPVAAKTLLLDLPVVGG